jgi:hypothetical protein
VRTPDTVGCGCEPGRRCTRRSETTRGGVVGAPCLSWSGRSGPGGGRAASTRREAARAEGFVAVVARAGGDGARPGSPLARLRQALRAGAHLPLPQAGMGWTTPRVRHPEQADRWSWLVLAAYTQLRLARARVADLRLPWERRYEPGRLTPVRVHRAVSSLLVELGTPAKPPKPCGRSPGRPKGRLSGRAKRYPALKSSA